jgi:hypothetical protein
MKHSTVRRSLEHYGGCFTHLLRPKSDTWQQQQQQENNKTWSACRAIHTCLLALMQMARMAYAAHQ